MRAKARSPGSSRKLYQLAFWFVILCLLQERDQQGTVRIGLEQTFDQSYETGIYHVAGVGGGMYRSLSCQEIAQVLLADGVDFCRQLT